MNVQELATFDKTVSIPNLRFVLLLNIFLVGQRIGQVI